MKKENQVLQQFFGGYFHQDWDIDDPNYEAVVRRYLADNSTEDATLLINELNNLLAANLPSSDLEYILINDYMSCYLPPKGVSASEWVHEVVRLLEKGLA